MLSYARDVILNMLLIVTTCFYRNVRAARFNSNSIKIKQLHVLIDIYNILYLHTYIYITYIVCVINYILFDKL